MGFMKNVSISAKTVAAFGAAFLMALGLGLVALRGAAEMNDKALDNRDNWLPSLRVLAEISSNAEQFRSLEAQYLLSVRPAERTIDALIADIVDNISVARLAYEPLITPGKERALVDEFFRDWDRYQAESRKLIEIARHDSDAAAKLYMGDHRALFVAMRAKLAADIALNEAGGIKSVEEGAAIYRKTRLYVIGAIGAAFLICMLGSAVVVAATSRPTPPMIAAKNRLADLT